MQFSGVLGCHYNMRLGLLPTMIGYKKNIISHVRKIIAINSYLGLGRSESDTT